MRAASGPLDNVFGLVSEAATNATVLRQGVQALNRVYGPDHLGDARTQVPVEFTTRSETAAFLLTTSVG